MERGKPATLWSSLPQLPTVNEFACHGGLIVVAVRDGRTHGRPLLATSWKAVPTYGGEGWNSINGACGRHYKKSILHIRIKEFRKVGNSKQKPTRQ